MRVGFVTCVQLGLSCMEAIHAAGGHIDIAVTLPDDRASQKSGRVYLDEFCAANRIELHKVNHVNGAAGILREGRLDWLFIVGWSQIASRDVIESARSGTLGMHPTLLPEGRGRAAIPWAILKGRTQTGVTLFKLDEGVDTGPIALQEIVPIGPREDATSLYARVTAAHVTLIERAWPAIASGALRFCPQDESRATYWPARRPADGAFDSTWTCENVDRLVRATTTPYPGAFIDLDGTRLRILAGQPHAGRRLAAIQQDGTDIWLPLIDGVFQATKWSETPIDTNL